MHLFALVLHRHIGGLEICKRGEVINGGIHRHIGGLEKTDAIF